MKGVLVLRFGHEPPLQLAVIQGLGLDDDRLGLPRIDGYTNARALWQRRLVASGEWRLPMDQVADLRVVDGLVDLAVLREASPRPQPIKLE